MNKRLLSVFGFALVVSALATVAIYKMLSARMASATPVAQNKVLVATHDLQIGSLINATDVRMADWYGAAPKGTPLKPEDAVNRGVVTPIYEGEPVMETRLASKGAGGGLAATIPMGMRAVAVRVNDVVGVAGFVVPGMRVDVLISGTPPANASQGTLTRTVLQNIQVLSAGQKIEHNGEGKPETASVVNLLVNPEQAEILSLASNQMHVQLVLRNPLDTKETATPGTATAKLFSGTVLEPVRTVSAPRAPRPAAPAPTRVPDPAPKVQPPPPPPPFIVEVIHGSKKVQMQFPTVTAEAKK